MTTLMPRSCLPQSRHPLHTHLAIARHLVGVELRLHQPVLLQRVNRQLPGQSVRLMITPVNERFT